MLIFAATTNEGNGEPVRYPARYTSHVLPMYASNGHIQASRLNASHIGGESLAMLGEDIRVPVAGPGGSSSCEVKAGTSYSTALAAGFAARLMDFARHSDVVEIIGQNSHRMGRTDWMKKVLCSLADKDDGFHCIKPWGPLETERRHAQSNHDERKRVREGMARTILRALQQI